MKSKKNYAFIFLGIITTFFIFVPKIDLGLVFSHLYGEPVEVPNIKYAEFPFKLTYENSIELIVIEDTVVCDYRGVSCNAAGCYRDWEYSLKSENEFLVLNKTNENVFAYYPTGNCRFYMNDFPNGGTYKHAFPGASEFIKNGTLTTRSNIDSTTLSKKYSIKLFSWEYSDSLKKGEIFGRK